MVFLDTYDVVVVEGVADELHFPGGGVAEAARVPGEDAEARVATLMARAGDRFWGRWAAPVGGHEDGPSGVPVGGPCGPWWVVPGWAGPVGGCGPGRRCSSSVEVSKLSS